MNSSFKNKSLFEKLDTKFIELYPLDKDIQSGEGKKPGFMFKLKTFFLNFTVYELIWMLVIIALTLVLSILLPEEDVASEKTGKVLASGVLITVLYFFDSVIGCFCELMFSKQNKWAFLLYNVVEVLEIACMLLLRTRFASMAVCIFFWIPAHTAGFFEWRRHKDNKQYETTKVRRLKKWQTILIMVGVVVISAGIGYFMAKINVDTSFYANDTIEKISAYVDASLAVMSILDGILMFFRSRESWWTWYIYVVVETFFNILNGQWVLLAYKFGYFTNGLYGNYKWTRYIKKEEKESQ